MSVGVGFRRIEYTILGPVAAVAVVVESTLTRLPLLSVILSPVVEVEVEVVVEGGVRR